MLKDSKISTLKLDPIAGPADFYIHKDILYIPKMMENKILITPIQ